MSLTVATYWWQPDEGSKFAAPYTPDDVRLLQRQVERYLGQPHEFVVITDRPEDFSEDVRIRPVQIDRATHLPGTCFVRLMTFSPEAREVLGDKVLQLDLDTVIVGGLDSIVARTADLVMWKNPTRSPRFPGRPAYNTSVLLHRTGTMTEVWRRFVAMTEEQQRAFKDDQWYLSSVLGDGWPCFDGVGDGIYRLARADTPGSGVDGELPMNARIVTFPGSDGKPDDPEIAARNTWIASYRR